MRRWVAEHRGWPDQGRQLWEGAEEARITQHTWQSMQNRWRRTLKRSAGTVTAGLSTGAAAAGGARGSANPRPRVDRIRRSLARSPSPGQRRLELPRAQPALRWVTPNLPPAASGERSLSEGAVATASSAVAAVDLETSLFDFAGAPPRADEDSSVAECSPGSEIATPAPAHAELAASSERAASASPSAEGRTALRLRLPCIRLRAECGTAERSASPSPPRQRQRRAEAPAPRNVELLAQGEIQHILRSAPQWLQERQLDMHIDPDEL